MLVVIFKAVMLLDLMDVVDDCFDVEVGCLDVDVDVAVEAVFVDTELVLLIMVEEVEVLLTVVEVVGRGLNPGSYTAPPFIACRIARLIDGC